MSGKKNLVSAVIVTSLVLFLASSVLAGQVKMTLSLGNSAIIPLEKSMNYVKIGLSGIPIENAKERSPVNLAIVLDKSGSMQGTKLQHAKEAAIMAVDRLNSNDILSVIAYDSAVEVLVPATKVSDKTSIVRAIRNLSAGTNTALFAGVSKGAAEIRKFLDLKRVNRVILLSDGLANEGPSSPAELGDLGASLRKEGISVTTFGLGLGYNEDLMAQLAANSDGNHAFIEKPEELAKVFNLEFGDVLSVVAQKVLIEIDCVDFQPIRLLGRDGEIRGKKVVVNMNQLYGNQEKFIILEVENPKQPTAAPSAQVRVSYMDMKSSDKAEITGQVEGYFTEKKEEVVKTENREVMVSVVNLIANETYKYATKLRDEGKVEQAKRNLEENKGYLIKNSSKYDSKALKDFAEQMELDAGTIDDEKEWSRTRKGMRKNQHTADHQQSY